MKRGMSWRIDWMLIALALASFGVARGVLPYFSKISALSDGFEAEQKRGVSTGEQFLLVIAILLALGFLARLGYRFFGKK